MCNKNFGIILLSGVLTFGTAASAFSQTSPQQPADPAATQKTTPEQAHQRDTSSKNKTQKDTVAGQHDGRKAQEALKDKGQLREEVRQIQMALQDKGLDPGRFDGVMGPKTRQAIADFQRQNNLPASGEIDDRTRMALGVGTTKTGEEQPAREKPTDIAPLPDAANPLPDNPRDNPPESSEPRQEPGPSSPEPRRQPADRVEPDAQRPGTGNAGTSGRTEQTPNAGIGTASSVEDIRLMQIGLKNRGFDPGEINGMISSQTQNAIREFQAANNLPVTGILDDRTQAALGVNVRGTTNPDTKGPTAPDNKTTRPDTNKKPSPDLSSVEYGTDAAASFGGGPSEQVRTEAEKAKEQAKDKAAEAKADKDDDVKDLQERVTKAVDVVQALTAAEDKRIPNEILSRAEGIVIIPNMIKGAFGIGGRYGKGVAVKRLASGTWSAPAFVTIGGGSFGAQLGVSSTDLVLVFADKGAFDALQNKMTLKLGADAAAVAGPIGRAGEAGVTHDLKSGIYAYSRSKGLFAGVALDGAVLDLDKSDNRKMYGTEIEAAKIFADTTMANNPGVRALTEALNRAAAKKPANN